MDWNSKTETECEIPQESKLVRDGGAFLDISKEGDVPLEFGKETLFVNASIRICSTTPKSPPFVVDIDLPLAES
jgi:hypothetical protein